ncbi:aryl-sulfate sulfotransferase [Candidatus Pacearchaeota archaeon]|nr:aryl-sulfate sulfotransferase [Candidatus Pacearchaeota archaeon]
MNLKAKRKIVSLLGLVGVAFLLYAVFFSKKNVGVEAGPVSSTNENADLKKLSSLGYMDWAPIALEDLEKSGVTKYDPQLACEGINLYCSEEKQGGHLVDMTGKNLHSFTDKRLPQGREKWQFIEPYHDDEFLVIIQCKEVFKIDWDSNVKKRYAGLFHHDIAITDDGSMYTVMHEKIDCPEICTTEPVRDDWLVLITENGEIERKVSFARMFLKNKSLFDVVSNQETKRYLFGKDAWDIFHVNSVEIINRNVFIGDSKLFEKGCILCSIRHLNLIVVVDVAKENIVWHWGLDEVSFPHHASLLENGNILLFDNGVDRCYSRVVEVDPATKKIEWEYKSDPPESFYTATRGSAQRLPNGNTLIAESEKGRVFEITRDGTIVWEFYNPEIMEIHDKKTGERQGRRATIYRMLRIFETGG